MEVGAVKQAFNNEVILLKKKLNQAKIQIIHKLTRKAKQLTEKKAPEPIQEKFKRKAESAVKEVLILKKINPKDLAKFIVTHKGTLNEFLNKPQIDNDKACARLLLHKALQDKYKFIRGRFSNVPIQDLFMSRIERRKIKKEAKEKQKNKKKGKDNKVVNSAGDWDVEDVNMTNLSKNNDDDEMSGDEGNDSDDNKFDEDANEELDGGSDHSDMAEAVDNSENEDGIQDSESEVEDDNKKAVVESEVEDDNKKAVVSIKYQNKCKADNKVNKQASESEDTDNEIKIPVQGIPKVTPEKINKQQQKDVVIPQKKQITKKNPEKKQKEVNKSKMFNEKIQQKKCNKDAINPVVENKIVDPFFVTSTGENYMSVAEPRAPDEFKEEHRQGNRKLRRAVMFGHIPNIRPRKDNYRENNDRFRNNFDKGNNNFNGNRDNFRGNNKFNDKPDFNDRKQFNVNNDRAFNNRPDFNNRNDKRIEEKDEKLHPSWEAKKKKSGILPFEGKKIVFDES